MQISVLGLGYIGLPTAAMFASHGVRVFGVDVNEEICKIINNGGVHIEEPHLGDIIKEQVAQGMITCSPAVLPSDAFLIAVPTPLTAEKEADLSYVVSAGESISKVLKRGDLVVLESTVSPGCTLDVLMPVLEKSGLKAGADFYLAHCPERVLPGQIIHELKHNSRVIGGVNRKSAEKSRELYSVFVEGDIFLTDTITAELCKLMENTYRDVNIALANELAKICELLGTNAWEVIRYANKHPRVSLHSPGPGVGGHCLAVDPWFVVASAPDTAAIIKLSRQTNDSMPAYVAGRVKSLVPYGSKVVILGCTYKPNIDDMRESPIMELVGLMVDHYELEIVDPFIDAYNTDVYRASEGADLVILAVHHQRFAEIDLARLAQVVRSPVLLDTRDFFSRSGAEGAGFEYHLLGANDLAELGSRGAEKEVAPTNE